MTETTLTPMLRQYQELKQQHPGTLLFFRLGDFYELFFDDAVTGARELEITLTARHKERGAAIPMCGVPHHAIAGYVARLIRKGYRVAICEQTEDPTKTKKLVRREVVRVITPGTAIDPQLIEAREAIYLAAVCGAGERYGAAFLDLSTGEFRVTEAKGVDAWTSIRADIESYAPRELLFPASLTPLISDAYPGRTHTTPLPLSLVQPAHINSQPAPLARIMPAEATAFAGLNTTLTPLDDWLWEPISCATLLLEQFGVRTLEGYGLQQKESAVSAAGACLRYARETQREAAVHINDINYFAARDHLVLDAVTVRNLELVEAQNDAGRMHTLLGTIDATVTGMGARLLRSWLLRPSLKRGEIEARQTAVEHFYGSQITRDQVRARLKDVSDLERLCARVSMNTATPRDLAALRRSLEQVPAIRRTLSDAEASLLQVLHDSTDELPDVCELLAQAISEDPPLNLADLGAIRDGYSTELDELRAINRDAKQTIAALEARERARSGINSLRVRFNNVFGYFIEVSKASAARVPHDYERRQTLANAERYTTPELKEWEQRVRGAEERIRELETSLFADVRARVAAEMKRLQTTARALAMLDVVAALATTAVRQRYNRPVLHDGDEIEIVAGRHPVIEATSSAPFIPNDLYMNNSTDRLLIITGPNMGGKCLSGETLIFTDRGLLPIRDLMPDGATANTFSALSCQVQTRLGRGRATHFYRGGDQATIQIKTRFGYQLEGTPAHRVWVRHADGAERWKRLDELVVSDMLAIDRRVDLWGQETCISFSTDACAKRAKQHRLPVRLDEDMAYLMGLLIGAGTLTYQREFVLTTADEFLATEFARIVSRLFGYEPARQRGRIAYVVCSRQIRTFLAHLGVGYHHAHEKQVPPSIMCAPKSVVAAFLQGLFDTDGWAANRQAKVYLSTASPRLAREVQLLLLNFGIVASLRVKRTKARPAYLLALYGAEAINFHELIGFRLPRKRERRSLASDVRRPNIDIPHLAVPLRAVQARIVAKHDNPLALKRVTDINSIFYTYLPQGRNVSYRKLNELIAYCAQSGIACPELQAVSGQRYFYDPVVNIERGTAEVFDLSVAQEHSYIANGLVSHNSTVLRQTALIALLAQTGSFVPAERARLPLFDRIWTRVGASDDLSRGRSTFMVEMTETAAILHNASPRSLVVLDEIGRGTATFDGLSIAWAVAEHLHDSPAHAAKTLFATHYHELTELAERLPGAQNYQIRVAEREGEVIFLYRLERGRASKSYGIEVARLAGLPPAVLIRAREVLERLERYELAVFTEQVEPTETNPAPMKQANAPQVSAANVDDGALTQAARRVRRQALAAQATLFDVVNQSLLDELRNVAVETLSHEEIRALLINIRKRIV